jgi:hypothetical protein
MTNTEPTVACTYETHARCAVHRTTQCRCSLYKCTPPPLLSLAQPFDADLQDQRRRRMVKPKVAAGPLIPSHDLYTLSCNVQCAGHGPACPFSLSLTLFFSQPFDADPQDQRRRRIESPRSPQGPSHQAMNYRLCCNAQCAAHGSAHPPSLSLPLSQPFDANPQDQRRP